ncbi:hypothetical protein SEUCBS139899_001479 [Sporothrix eucalyptigena]|uniref:Uncharacterized protein n=1 Tax=Sporothrix eucalyptigena TaxID=1812306 RepID=A0ABP0BK66_9PEZI
MTKNQTSWALTPQDNGQSSGQANNGHQNSAFNSDHLYRQPQGWSRQIQGQDTVQNWLADSCDEDLSYYEDLQGLPVQPEIVHEGVTDVEESDSHAQDMSSEEQHGGFNHQDNPVRLYLYEEQLRSHNAHQKQRRKDASQPLGQYTSVRPGHRFDGDEHAVDGDSRGFDFHRVRLYETQSQRLDERAEAMANAGRKFPADRRHQHKYRGH